MKKQGCVICGNDLPRMRRKFCTDTCAAFYESRRKKHLVKYNLRALLEPRNCSLCGEEFMPHSDRNIYCSATCCRTVLSQRRSKRREKIRRLGISNTVWNKQTKGFGKTSGSGNKCRKNGQYGHMIELDIPKVTVETASFTPSDTEERVELKSKVEEYLANGGKIAKYGAQPAVIQEEALPSWQVTEQEEQVEVESYREVEVDVYNGY